MSFSQKSNFILIGFIIIIFISVLVMSLTSEDVDEICTDAGTYLYRNDTSWGCVALNITNTNSSGDYIINGQNISANMINASVVLYAGKIGVNTKSPSVELDVVGSVEIDSRVNSQSGNILDVSGYMNATHLTSLAFANFANYINVSSNSTTNYRALYFANNPYANYNYSGSMYGAWLEGARAQNFNMSGSNFGTVYGINSIGFIPSTSTASNYTVASARGANLIGISRPSSGANMVTASSSYGLSVASTDTFIANITNSYGIYVNQPTVGANISNNYGLYLADQRGSKTRNYSIYSNGGMSYFKDAIGLNVLPSSYMLDVNGSSRFNGNITAPNICYSNGDNCSSSGGSFNNTNILYTNNTFQQLDVVNGTGLYIDIDAEIHGTTWFDTTGFPTWKFATINETGVQNMFAFQDSSGKGDGYMRFLENSKAQGTVLVGAGLWEGWESNLPLFTYNRLGPFDYEELIGGGWEAGGATLYQSKFTTGTYAVVDPDDSSQVSGVTDTYTDGVDSSIEFIGGIATTISTAYDNSLMTGITYANNDTTQLSPVTFYWNNQGLKQFYSPKTEKQIGYIAQDVQKYYPDCTFNIKLKIITYKNVTTTLENITWIKTPKTIYKSAKDYLDKEYFIDMGEYMMLGDLKYYNITTQQANQITTNISVLTYDKNCLNSKIQIENNNLKNKIEYLCDKIGGCQ